jgi:hypothetical protein
MIFYITFSVSLWLTPFPHRGKGIFPLSVTFVTTVTFVTLSRFLLSAFVLSAVTIVTTVTLSRLSLRFSSSNKYCIFASHKNRKKMGAVINRQAILREIDVLNYTEKLYLLSYITDDLIRSNTKISHNLIELKGLGKEMWKNKNIDNYIKNERESWE